MGQAFFTEKGDELVPASHASSPWSKDMLHGRLLGGLMTRAAEREHLPEGMRVARITVDLYRNSPLVPLRVTTSVVRDGRRIRVVDAEVVSEQGKVARASFVMLRETAQEPSGAWAPPPWNVPSLAELGSSPMSVNPTFEMWNIAPRGEEPAPFESAARRRVWVREIDPLVEGEEDSPLVNVALAADLASPLAHFGGSGLLFINADYTVNLSRLPVSEEIGLESSGHYSADGIAAGQCVLYDSEGPIGFCATTAVANG